MFSATFFSKHLGCVGFVLISSAAMAQPQVQANSSEGTLPSQPVACTSLRQSQAYARAQRDNPAFAADLLARATCFVPEANTQMLSVGKPQKGYQQFQLLSGHTVWLPTQPGR
jgi:hypothetical protein